MSQPRWDDPELKGGVMIRGALWLLQEVGVGQIFTKADIRLAFPAAVQADRRIRDLRDYGWVLHTRADDASLLREQTRLVAPGADVWDPRSRRAASSEKGISARARHEVMSRDGYMCKVCGITGGEEYSDEPTQTALLVVTRTSSGGGVDACVTLCKRCKSGGGGRSGVERTADALKNLSNTDLREFEEWVRLGRRPSSAAERAWSLYLRLPEKEREILRSRFDVG